MTDNDLKSQEVYDEIQNQHQEKILTLAIQYAKDDDYSISQDLFDRMCNDDTLRKLVNQCATAWLQGRHPECLQMGIVITKFAASFYEEFAGDNYD